MDNSPGKVKQSFEGGGRRRRSFGGRQLAEGTGGNRWLPEKMGVFTENTPPAPGVARNLPACVPGLEALLARGIRQQSPRKGKSSMKSCMISKTRRQRKRQSGL